MRGNIAGKWKAPPAPEANIFRIFISTDNHLGYAEKNDYPPRQDDSFRAVEEVLENATAAQARNRGAQARASTELLASGCVLCLMPHLHDPCVVARERH